MLSIVVSAYIFSRSPVILIINIPIPDQINTTKRLVHSINGEVVIIQDVIILQKSLFNGYNTIKYITVLFDMFNE